jgi:OOP family OmpA-OmpF porin
MKTTLVSLMLALLVGASLAADPPKPAQRTVVRSQALPAQGLFDGERLSPSARKQLDTLLADADDIDVEVALVVPAGPWKVEGRVVDEHSLTPGRLRAVKDYLAARGVPTARIYVESRIDNAASEPRLQVELVGKPAPM